MCPFPLTLIAGAVAELLPSRAGDEVGHQDAQQRHAPSTRQDDERQNVCFAAVLAVQRSIEV